MMTALDHLPALILGRSSEVLACNALLRAVLGDEVAPGTLVVRWLFRDPRARARIINWADYAAPAVGALRFELGRNPHDRRLTALVEELRTHDPDFAEWWLDHRVTDQTSVDKRIAHPTTGPLSFGIEMLATPYDPQQRLITYTCSRTRSPHGRCP